ncbi:uncharacterized protein il17rb isoform X2 [Pagrus major]|uniref:uncharacterized protein il17rb isoform X2 n=1 Tax=Pagrus major TaxID=143350 RepID=UPI003CC8AE36
MMWGVTLIFVSSVLVLAASHEIQLECREFHGLPPVGSVTPSLPADLKVELVTVGERYVMNISWAIEIDGSVESLTGTRIVVQGEGTFHCAYNPPFAKLDPTGPKQIWFHHLVQASNGITSIQAANLPLPPQGSGPTYKLTRITIPSLQPRSTTPKTTTRKLRHETTTVPTDKDDPVNSTSITVAIFGGLASLMILSSCYIIYKSCGANFASSLGFKVLPTSPMVPVPVLVVYPAENSAFQRAVVALAEFLQWHGGCSVAVDMWQQGKIAELGPMRWLAEQAKAADRVLIVCPQAQTPSDSPPNHSLLPEPSIPAAAHDLYPLILNMVASHAKSTSDLDKFWVVQLGDQQAKRSSNLALELRACKTFHLMKDLAKLCRSLHTKCQGGKKISNPFFKPGIEKSSLKLREAVEKLGGHQPGIFREVEPLKSVVTTI